MDTRGAEQRGERCLKLPRQNLPLFSILFRSFFQIKISGFLFWTIKCDGLLWWYCKGAVWSLYTCSLWELSHKVNTNKGKKKKLWVILSTNKKNDTARQKYFSFQNAAKGKMTPVEYWDSKGKQLYFILFFTHLQKYIVKNLNKENKIKKQALPLGSFTQNELPQALTPRTKWCWIWLIWNEDLYCNALWDTGDH